MSRLKTPLSAAILEQLSREHYLTVPQLVMLLEQAGAPYNKTSVYRALEKLVKQEKICKLNFATNEIVYELREGHHDHLVCMSCGTVAAAPCESAEPKKIGQFLVNHHHLTYFGICEKCQAKN